MGAGSRMPVGSEDMCLCRFWRAPGGAAVDAGTGVPVGDTVTCSLAAAGGHLAVLQWARVHHCPWNKWTCYFAAENQRLEVLQWARAHGCPWNKRECEYVSWRHPDTQAWVRAQPE